MSTDHKEGARVLVDFQNVSVGAGVEPIMVIAALYDVRRKCKVGGG